MLVFGEPARARATVRLVVSSQPFVNNDFRLEHEFSGTLMTTTRSVRKHRHKSELREGDSDHIWGGTPSRLRAQFSEPPSCRPPIELAPQTCPRRAQQGDRWSNEAGRFGRRMPLGRVALHGQEASLTSNTTKPALVNRRFGTIAMRFSACMPILARIWPTQAEIAQMRPNPGRLCLKFDRERPKSVDVGPNSDNLGPNLATLGRHGDRFWSECDQLWPNVARNGPILTRFGIDLGRMFSNFSQIWPATDQLGQPTCTWGEFDQV